VDKRTDDKMKELHQAQMAKMWRFADTMVREFKYMNKLQEQKILFEIGFKEKMEEAGPHAQVGDLFNEIMSFESAPSFACLQGQRPAKRHNSVYKYRMSVPKKVEEEKKQKESESRSERELDDMWSSQTPSQSAEESINVYDLDFALENAW